MTDKVVLVYERTSASTYEYNLIGIVIPAKLYSKVLPSSPSVEAEIALYDPIYSKEEEEELKKIRESADFIPIDC